MNEILGVDYYGGFFVKAESLEAVGPTGEEIDKRLARSLGVPSRDLENDDAKPYVLFDQLEILEQTNQLSTALTALLTSVALISLIVGSIGIMNIMLVTVAERTKEIGLLKSLGYTKNDILALFIIESMVVGLIGGILGTAMGIGAALIVNNYLELPNIFPVEQIFIGFAVAIIVGLIAGVYPANKAANMNPVEALRKE
jgi:putative ABC transport system permease protein